MDALSSRPAPAIPPPGRILAGPWSCPEIARADGAFFYSVETTGVYCRPSCAARRPNLANVRFHASAADAEAAGFRPCKRCRPDAAPLAERYAAKVSAACRLIEAADAPPALGRTGAGPRASAPAVSTASSRRSPA